MNVHGSVTVRFRVKHSGLVDDLKILRSLSPALDEEAIRLIKKGPQWKVLKKRRGYATVTVTF
jgi:TonB family protein